MILFAAATAAIAELSRWHRQEQPVVAVDQLYVANDERVIECQRAKRFEAPAGADIAEADANF